MNRRRWLLIFILAAIGGGVWWARRSPERYPNGYIADRSATLWSATAQVRRVVVVDAQGNRNRFDFNNPIVNTPVPPSEFTFTPPSGTSVVTP